MAQGKFKKQGSLPGGSKGKSSNKHKKHGPKRGGRVIAPKKTKQIEATKIKRGLEKAIKATIEHDVAMKAQSVEPKHFKLVKPSQPSAETGGSVKKK